MENNQHQTYISTKEIAEYGVYAAAIGMMLWIAVIISQYGEYYIDQPVDFIRHKVVSPFFQYDENMPSSIGLVQGAPGES